MPAGRCSLQAVMWCTSLVDLDESPCTPGIIPSKPQSEARKDAASGTTQPKEPADDRDFAKKTADCKSYEEQLEVYWADCEENPDYWESDEDYVGPS